MSWPVLCQLSRDGVVQALQQYTHGNDGDCCALLCAAGPASWDPLLLINTPRPGSTPAALGFGSLLAPPFRDMPAAKLPGMYMAPHMKQHDAHIKQERPDTSCSNNMHGAGTDQYHAHENGSMHPPRQPMTSSSIAAAAGGPTSAPMSLGVEANAGLMQHQQLQQQ